jgi:nucleoside-diphosphate-sugar epimerase
MMKTALVTGSAGFIGSALVPKLKAAGYEVWRVDPVGLPTSDTDFACSFEQLMAQGWVLPNWDVIVHLGSKRFNIAERAKGGIRHYHDMALDFQVMQYVSQHPPREAFIYPSSCAQDAADTDSYGFVKRTGERMCKELAREGVPVKILRLFGGYSENSPECEPFGGVLHRALRREDPLVVWGNLGTTRDWVALPDVVEAFLWAINGAPVGVPIEIGTGVPTSFYQLACLLTAQVGYAPAIEHDERKPTSAPYRVANTKLARDYGWEAKIPLQEGVRQVVERCLSLATQSK